MKPYPRLGRPDAEFGAPTESVSDSLKAARVLDGTSCLIAGRDRFLPHMTYQFVMSIQQFVQSRKFPIRHGSALFPWRRMVIGDAEGRAELRAHCIGESPDR